MPMQCIIGVDPGMRCAAWGVIELSEDRSVSYVASGTLKTSRTSLKFGYLFVELQKVLKHYNPHYVAIENTYVNSSSKDSLKLANARGALLAAIEVFGLQVSEYQAKSIKKSIAGNGNADKLQMLKMLKLWLPSLLVTDHNEVDALSVAVCHVNCSVLLDQ